MLNRFKTATLALIFILPIASFGMERSSLLPPDAQTYVRISNTVDFWTNLKKSSMGQLWADQQFQDFLGHPDAEVWTEFFANGETDAEDEVFLEQMKMLKGEVIIALDLKSHDPYIIATMDKADFIKSLALDDTLRGVMEDPFEIVKSTFQDVEIIQHIDGSGTPEEDSSWQAHIGQTLLLGYSLEWIERSIIQLKKDEIKEPEGDPVLSLSIPLAQMIEQSLIDDGTAASERALFEALGLLDIELFSSTLTFKSDELVVDNILGISNLDKGLFTLLDVQPSELPTVTFIPENIASLEIGRLNLLRFWQEIPQFLITYDSQMKPQFDMLLAMIQQQMGINIEEDLLAHLGTQYVAFSVVEGEAQSSVMAVDLKDSRAFQQGLEMALSSPAMQPYIASSLEISDFLDHTIYTLKDSDPVEAMGIAIVGDHLLYADPDGLRQVIRSATSDAAKNQAFERSDLVKGLRQHVSPRAFGYSAIDWEKNMDVIMHELTKSEYIGLIQQNWAKSGSALPPPDFNKLPPADHIASFFNISFQYIEAKGNGLHQQIILKY